MVPSWCHFCFIELTNSIMHAIIFPLTYHSGCFLSQLAEEFLHAIVISRSLDRGRLRCHDTRFGWYHIMGQHERVHGRLRTRHRNLHRISALWVLQGQGEPHPVHWQRLVDQWLHPRYRVRLQRERCLPHSDHARRGHHDLVPSTECLVDTDHPAQPQAFLGEPFGEHQEGNCSPHSGQPGAGDVLLRGDHMD